MVESDAGHCKDRGHVRVVVSDQSETPTKFTLVPVYRATTTCVNVPDYTGWVIELTQQSGSRPARSGLRLLPDLAEVIPSWLRRAARSADTAMLLVKIQHTFAGEWDTFAALSPGAARKLAKQITAELVLAPPGEFG